MKYQYKIVYKEESFFENQHGGFYYIYFKYAGKLGYIMPWSRLGIESTAEAAKKRIERYENENSFKPVIKIIDIIK